jgi:hypothetical protein
MAEKTTRTVTRKNAHYTVESRTEKGSGIVNEDALILNPSKGIFGVADGAVSRKGYTDSKGNSGARIASQILKSTFERTGPLPKGSSDLQEMVFEANTWLAESMRTAGINVDESADRLNKLNRWLSSIAVVKMGSRSFNWLQMSDTNILAVHKDGSHRLMVENYDHDGFVLVEYKKMLDAGVKDAYEKSRQMISDNQMKINVPGPNGVAFGGISGEPSEKLIPSISKGTYSLDGVRSILIFSDGLLLPQTDPAKPDNIKGIVKAYTKGGIQAWFDLVRGLENSDPEMKKYLRFKDHDDVSVVAIDLK